MKKLLYYSSYIPVIGLITTAIESFKGNNTCLSKPLHYLLSAFIQSISIFLIIINFIL